MRRRKVSLFRNLMNKEPSPLYRLWFLRILIPLGGFSELARTCHFSDFEKWATEYDFSNLIDIEDKSSRQKKVVFNDINAQYQQAELDAHNIHFPKNLEDNLEKLSKIVGLNAIDMKILGFTVLLSHDEALKNFTDILGEMNTKEVGKALAIILNLDEPQVHQALKSNGALFRSGMLRLDSSLCNQLHNKLELLSIDLADVLLRDEWESMDLVRGKIVEGAKPDLSLNDYEHLSEPLSILMPFLKHALATKRKGVNLFLYGAPGTGKTQLVRAITHHLSNESPQEPVQLLEVAVEDHDQKLMSRNERLQAFSAGQLLASDKNVLMVFDEVDEIFETHLESPLSFMFQHSKDSREKGWINTLLEENRIPTFWISNNINGLDPAYVRRFDMMIEMPIPPRQQREKIIKQHAEDLLALPQINRLAESDHLAPAVVARAASVVKCIRTDLGEAPASEAMEWIINATIKSQGHPQIRKTDPNRLPETYDPAFINAKVDLALIAEGIKAHPSARLCLYGPPGTGKTAYGRWLAQLLGRPLLVRRASDLLSKWVGDNEKNIAEAFAQAEREKSVLLIDEVDSFLQDRRGASKSWEVSGVNEMLTQMESFSGVFIASTNLMDGLDQAALRRFDLKVHFDYLLPEQVEALFRKHCQQFGYPDTSQGAIATLRRINNLTPGDFAAVRRQHTFRKLNNACDWVDALIAESGLKEDAKARMGFLN